MISLTQIGKEQLKNTYPNVVCEIIKTNKQNSYNISIMFVFFDFVKIYTYCNIVMNIVCKDTSDYNFARIIIILLIPVVYIVFNTIITLLTSYKCCVKPSCIVVNSDMSFHAFINQGRFKLGVFQSGSIFRHVLMYPVIDTGLNISILVSTLLLMSIKNNQGIDGKMALEITKLLYAAELLFGIFYVLLSRDENIFSFTPVIEFSCFRKITSVGVLNDTKETEEDNEEEVHEQEGPFYRSFSV
jgi:hypothetical protein